MRKIPKFSRGFTLIEMLLYVAASSFFLLTIVTFFSFVISTQSKNQMVQEVNQQGVFIIEHLTQAIRKASDSNTPAYGASSSLLSLSTNSSSTNPTVFYVSNGVMYVQEGTSTSVALSNTKVSIKNLSFLNTSASTTQSGTIQVQFTISTAGASSSQEHFYEKEFTASGTFY
jgi:Tfp pilus assembly protein PilW